ncbi:DNA replication/repair protein RecF [Tamilnaduibacter salinus]|uniref:DNA replication and repair protein RecF n=1 Tax=Tamilnaduibacter salinus TaxID=1484056 RepID=A0A2A2I6Y5_9GAMM|nr:DNA replication/repair protein RecF [Tamilnaduibacter salinus]PAV26885.1 DNA replication/repair protein RecF [Tamilnaduibacter salinus]
MALIRLQTQHFRNLAPQSLRLSPSVNLIYGENGSGKSSFLEAVGYLGLGRSFRVNRHDAVVQHGEAALTVFGEVTLPAVDEAREESHRIGYSRNTTERETRLRVDGESVRQLSTVAQYLPVSVIDPGTFEIVAGGPGRRRQFLDWLVFHVEHGFASDWQRLQRVVSQRNKLLRNDRMDESLLRLWDQQYVELAERVTATRSRVFEQFLPCLQSLIGEANLPWAESIGFDFFRGWDRKTDLGDVLRNHRDQEHRVGHTQYGPNRADIRLRLAGRPVSETLSRGQQKTLVVLMKLAQARLLCEKGTQCIFLLDDINAELDESNRALLASRIRDLGSQAFITSIEPPHPEQLWGDARPDFKVFHVEHGKLTEE